MHSEAAVDLHFVKENHLEATHGFLCLFMLDLLVVCLSYTFHLKQQHTASVLFVFSIVVFFSFFLFQRKLSENAAAKLLDKSIRLWSKTCFLTAASPLLNRSCKANEVTSLFKKSAFSPVACFTTQMYYENVLALLSEQDFTAVPMSESFVGNFYSCCAWWRNK